MKKISLKFWNNMIVLSVLILFLISSVSAADTALSDQNSVVGSSDESYNDVQASLTDEAAVKAYDAMSLVEPKAMIKSVNSLSLVSGADYEIESTYTVTTNKGLITVSITSQVNAETRRINVLNKRIVQSGKEVIEKDDELLVVYKGELTTISVENKEYAQKMLVNAVELLVEKETIETPVLSSQKEFVVMVDKTPDFSYERELVSTENYKFYVVKSSDLTTLASSDSIVKICEAKKAHLENFVKYSKEVLSAEAEQEMKRLELKKTMLDCSEPIQLKVYMDEEWDTQSGQSSPYQQFVTPDASILQELSNGKTAQELYEIAKYWIWASDEYIHGEAEKWLLPEEFLLGTPSYSTNPSPGNAVSDCSEQANTLVSLLRASGVSAEDVRVVLGKVDFDGNIGGHAWVEIKEDGRWMVLDPTCGRFYDQVNEEVITRNGVGYRYWEYHLYPVVEVWRYYNDVYHTNEKAEVAPGWATQYDVFTGADMFAGFLFEESFEGLFVYVVIAAAAIISVVSLGLLKKKESGKK